MAWGRNEEKKEEKTVGTPGASRSGRDAAIELAVSSIEKQFGKGSILRLGADEKPKDVQVVPTGSLALDIALGAGGLPRGRVVEIYGPESSGKTTLTLHAIAEAQKRGGICAFVDAEHALDVTYARRLGVKTDDLLVSQPDSGEQALEIADMLVRSGAIDVVVVDSVAALVPKAEIEGEMGDSHVGLQARLMSQALRKLTGTISKSNTLVIFINQIRMKIGVMFGNPETTTGGNALKFYASVRLDIRRIGALKDGEKVVGNRTRVKVVKNKMAPPFREVEFDILYGEGISHEGDLVDLGAECGAIEKSGAWFGFEGDRIGQGREKACSFLAEHPEIAEALRVRLLSAMKTVEARPAKNAVLLPDRRDLGLHALEGDPEVLAQLARVDRRLGLEVVHIVGEHGDEPRLADRLALVLRELRAPVLGGDARKVLPSAEDQLVNDRAAIGRPAAAPVGRPAESRVRIPPVERAVGGDLLRDARVQRRPRAGVCEVPLVRNVEMKANAQRRERARRVGRIELFDHVLGAHRSAPHRFLISSSTAAFRSQMFAPSR